MAVDLEMEVNMVAEASGIKDKKKLMAYLYKNPAKLALKLANFLKDTEGNPLPMIKLKGKGQGYYHSMHDKKFIRVCRDQEFYLLPWDDTRDNKKCFIYTHHNWLVGCILSVYKGDIEHLGYN